MRSVQVAQKPNPLNLTFYNSPTKAQATKPVI